jgi:hypothetical protein
MMAFKKILVAISFVWLNLFVISCGPTFNGGSALLPARENEEGILIYEDIDLGGKIISKTILKAPIEDIDKSKSSKSKSTVNIIEGDPQSPHIGVVFVGDGYNLNDMPQYQKDTNDIFKNLILQEPFKSYRSYFTFYRVDHITLQSGIGNTPSKGLGMHYNCNGIPRLLCINTSSVLAAAQNANRSDIIFALANSSEYGGAGYRNPTVSTLAARNPAALELALHELGHSFAQLGDEYEDKGSPTNCNLYPNISDSNFSEMAKKKTKWYRWQDLKNVSSFAGACYSSRFYRPTLESKMRTLGHAFGEINLEQFILQIYKKIKPIKSSTAVGTIKKHTVIEVQPMQPASHSLTVNWFLDGQPQKPLQNKTKIETKDLAITKNTHTLTATVQDGTSAVRDEKIRQKYLQQTLSWTLKL